LLNPIFAPLPVSINVHNLSKRYGSQLAVNDISFSIGTGEIVGFLGPNGAGKSTTMKMLTCFIPPTSGTAEVCGFSIGEQSMKVRSVVGYLPEHNPLYLDMYVKEYLSFAAGLGQVKNVKDSVERVISQTNLGSEQHKRIGQLSKGYRQRVGLAQAMIHDPQVLILDEPTSGFDPNQVLEIRSLIKELGKNKTILLSTHIMQEVEALCDRVIIINQGSIVADDKIADLQALAAGTFTVRVQFVSAVLQKSLLEIDGCISATNLEGNSWKLTGNHENFRQSVSQFALSRNLEVLELVSEKNSLEEIFRNLTTHVDHL
jgi:ABC-2 type transport system ATP-binding protein